MERLTSTRPWSDAQNDLSNEPGYGYIWQKLQRYEETGLEPEEIMEAVKLFSGTNVDVPKEIIGWVKRATWHCKRLAELTRLVSFDRLRELAQAEKEGRLVVLPCKVGESLWTYDKDKKPREMMLDPPDIRCHCKEEDNLCMALCSAKNTGVCAKRLMNDGSDIGKTVFLTREAAEAALKEREADHDR